MWRHRGAGDHGSGSGRIDASTSGADPRYPRRGAVDLAFAAGAVLASLADTLMPEAYEKGGPLVALSTTAGFVLSFVLATL